MTSVFGEGINYGVDFKEILNEIDGKIKLSEIKNEKKFVNETGDTITSLQISDEPKNLHDAVNLKYVKNLEIEITKQITAEITKLNEITLKQNQVEIEQIKSQVKNEIDKIKQENEIFKNGVEVLAKQIKSQIEKIKGDVARHTVNELRQQKENVEKFKTEFDIHVKQFKTEFDSHVKQFKTEIAKQEERMESHIKQFNLLNKNVTIFHGKVEKRFEEIIKKKLDKIVKP